MNAVNQSHTHSEDKQTTKTSQSHEGRLQMLADQSHYYTSVIDAVSRG